MEKTSCTVDGDLDISKFGKPMPWIGAYAAAAAAACALAMALDALHAFRYRKFWFPCKFFSLNATTLTLLTVATKLSVDLQAPMPRQQDQLAKLSSAVFVCTVIANFMPSLGTMENREILTNMVALGIFVVTDIVNICIQLGTGVIYVFWKEYAFVMFLMVALFALMVSSCLTIPATKCFFDLKYKKKHKATMEQCNYQFGKCISDNVSSKLREDLTKYWIMAQTCHPQFVLARLATSTASGALCLLSAAILAEAMLRSYLMPRRFHFCSGESEFKWSTTLILVIQTIAVAIGTIAPASRWFMAIYFTCPKKAKKAFQVNLAVENYWIHQLNEWKDCPLSSGSYGRQTRKLTESIKKTFLGTCIHVQTCLVLTSKLIRFVSVFFIARLLISSQKMIKSLKCKLRVPSNGFESESEVHKMQDLSHYVLHLEGEKELMAMMMERNGDPTTDWLKIGEMNQPKHLIKLLEGLTPAERFMGVLGFDSELVSSLDSDEPPNGWALPVVTLTSIAITLPNIDHDSIRQLIHSVDEALIYIRFIEENLDTRLEKENIRKAAEIVWARVDLQYKWLDVDLRKIAINSASPKEVLEELSNIAKERFMQSKEDVTFSLRDSPAKWPINALAANSMYRTTKTLLLGSENEDCQTGEKLFQTLSAMITDILGACLTNLQHVISEQCHQSNIEQREEKVRKAILLLGKTKTILDILEHQPVLSTDPEHRWHIDTWRVLSKQKPLQHWSSSGTASNMPSNSSSDAYLTID